MKKIFLIALIAGFVSCEKENIPENFLEKYHNTYLEAYDDGFYNRPTQIYL
jgi:hypothetical protein